MHRRDIEMIDAEAPPDAILAQAINSPHTRIPIFRGEPENIVGVIHAKDLSRAVHRFVQEHREGRGARGLRHHGRGDAALLRPRIDPARRAAPRVPAPAHPLRAGGRRVRRAAGARHPRGHHRGDRRRHRRRARRRGAGRHRAAARRLGRGRGRRDDPRPEPRLRLGSCPTRRPTPSPGSSSTRRRRSRARDRRSASTASASRCWRATATGSPACGCAGSDGARARVRALGQPVEIATERIPALTRSSGGAGRTAGVGAAASDPLPPEDADAAAGADEAGRHRRPDQRHVDGEQHQAERKHPEAEHGQEGEDAAEQQDDGRSAPAPAASGPAAAGPSGASSRALPATAPRTDGEAVLCPCPRSEVRSSVPPRWEDRRRSSRLSGRAPGFFTPGGGADAGLPRSGAPRHRAIRAGARPKRFRPVPTS